MAGRKFLVCCPEPPARRRRTARALAPRLYLAAMQLMLHNTLSGRKEIFRPIDPNRITLYVCGPTVYGHMHIGNGRPAVVFDVLRRLLRQLHPQARVVFVSNITDVDDKINKRALANGEPIEVLARRFSAAYNEDIAALGVLRADVQPKATEHIREIIAMIKTLLAKGFAYEAEGHVLFHVPADPNYGCLSHCSPDDMLDGARVEVAPYKKDAKDFVLWKPSTPELPGWKSPWGRGRPGWHIECSAMIHTHLGENIDIHGGGADLVFPHHENEAAQSRAAYGLKRWVGYWLHNGMLTMGKEKMSKSLGNIVTIHDLRQRHTGETLRYALLSAQYRSPLLWSDGLLRQAKRSLDSLYGALRKSAAGAEPQSPGANHPEEAAPQTQQADCPEPVLNALKDDLNTPQALAGLHAVAKALNKAVEADEVARLRGQLLAGGALLGLLKRTPDEHFHDQPVALHKSIPVSSHLSLKDDVALNKGMAASSDLSLGDDVVLDKRISASSSLSLKDDVDAGLSKSEIEALIRARSQARSDRNFPRADAIRDQLARAGIELEDSRTGGTRWKRVTHSN